MRIVVQVRLLPSDVEAAALAATLRTCNMAADHASRVAFERAQAAVRTVKKVVDAYASMRASARTGNLVGGRRAKAEGKPIRFREDAAQPFDDRMLSWRHDAGTVSIWTTAGRLKGIRFVGSPARGPRRAPRR